MQIPSSAVDGDGVSFNNYRFFKFELCTDKLQLITNGKTKLPIGNLRTVNFIRKHYI